MIFAKVFRRRQGSRSKPAAVETVYNSIRSFQELTASNNLRSSAQKVGCFLPLKFNKCNKSTTILVVFRHVICVLLISSTNQKIYRMVFRGDGIVLLPYLLFPSSSLFPSTHSLVGVVPNSLQDIGRASDEAERVRYGICNNQPSLLGATVRCS